MPKYVYTPPEGLGAKHWVRGQDKKPVPLKKGDIVEMTESAYKAFKDRFKPVAVVEAEAKVAAELAAAAKAGAEAKKDPASQGTQNPTSGSTAKS